MKTLGTALLMITVAAAGVGFAPAAEAVVPTTPAGCPGAAPGVTECTFQYYGLETASGSATSVGDLAFVTVHTTDGRMLPLQHLSGQGAGVYTSTTTFDARHIPWGTTLICRVHPDGALVSEFSCG